MSKIGKKCQHTDKILCKMNETIKVTIFFIAKLTTGAFRYPLTCKCIGTFFTGALLAIINKSNHNSLAQSLFINPV